MTGQARQAEFRRRFNPRSIALYIFLPTIPLSPHLPGTPRNRLDGRLRDLFREPERRASASDGRPGPGGQRADRSVLTLLWAAPGVAGPKTESGAVS